MGRIRNRIIAKVDPVPKYPKGYYIYKYYRCILDCEDKISEELVYVGRTTNPVYRYQQHWNNRDEESRMRWINKIEIAEVPNYETMVHYERYLITKLKPSTNVTYRDNEPPAFELPALDFKLVKPLSLCSCELQYEPFVHWVETVIKLIERRRYGQGDRDEVYLNYLDNYLEELEESINLRCHYSYKEV